MIKINPSSNEIIDFLTGESKMKQLMIISTLTIALTGCMPKMHTVSPKIEGKVVDAKTGKPLSGVRVGLKQTHLNGWFTMEGKRELGIGTPMGGVWRLPSVMLPVSKKGYRDTYCQCNGLSNTLYGCTNVTIALIPLGENVSDTMIKSTQSDNFSCQIIEKVEFSEVTDKHK